MRKAIASAALAATLSMGFGVPAAMAQTDTGTTEESNDDGSGKLGLLGLVGLAGLAGLARRNRRDDRTRTATDYDTATDYGTTPR